MEKYWQIINEYGNLFSQHIKNCIANADSSVNCQIILGFIGVSILILLFRNIDNILKLVAITALIVAIIAGFVFIFGGSVIMAFILSAIN